jgi:putative addiction module component (TIGR02574 family)
MEDDAMASVDEAFLAAQNLGTTEKLELIGLIWDTIPPTEFRPSDSDLDLIKQRWADYEAGKIKAIPWKEVWAEVEREFADDEN